MPHASRADANAWRRAQRAEWRAAGLCCCCGAAPTIGATCDMCLCRSRDYAARNPKKVKRAKIRHQHLTKRRVFEHYGTVCTCCGEAEPAFLTIDHPQDDGAEHRKVTGAGQRFYLWLIRSNFPAGLTVLCFNCNFGRYLAGGICPHETEDNS